MTNEPSGNDTAATDEHTTPNDTRTDTGAQTEIGRSVNTPRGRRIFEMLSTFLAGLPEEARREVHFEVLSRVHKGELAGFVHRGNVIALPMPLTGTWASREARPMEEVLLKATPDLTEQLEVAVQVVFKRQMVRERGRGLTVSELEEMVDEIDFDGMVEQDRKARAAASRLETSKARKMNTETKATAGKKKSRS